MSATNKTISPILMNASCTLVNSGAGIGIVQGRGVTDLARLINSSRTAVLIDEIRFRISSSNGAAGIPGVGGVLGVRLDLGRLHLTSGRFIPIALLCKTRDMTVENDPLNTALMYSPPSGAGAEPTEAVYVWKLARPLYLPGGSVLTPTFNFDPTILAGAFNLAGATVSVSVSYVGRALPIEAPVPPFVDVPFVGAWIDTIRTGASDAIAIRSTRSDLKNPHVEPVQVQRFSGLYVTNKSPYMPGEGAAANIESVGGQYITARLVKSDGSIICRDATPWLHLFDYTTRTLDTYGVLQRNEFYQIQADIKLATNGDPTLNVQLMAAIIGQRRVKFSPRPGWGFEER